MDLLKIKETYSNFTRCEAKYSAIGTELAELEKEKKSTEDQLIQLYGSTDYDELAQKDLEEINNILTSLGKL